MYHYIRVLYQLGARERVVHLWRDYIPQQALKHPFLMHGLLAFTALHLAYINPESSFKYLQVCDKHQAIALQKYRSILSSPRAVDPELADALFALSATLSLSSMARSCALSEQAAMDMGAVAELFVMTKGIANVIQLSREQIRQNPMAIMLEPQICPEGMKIDLQDTIAIRFEGIRTMLGTCDTLGSSALEDCRSALTELEETYKTIAYFESTALEFGAVSRWQVMISMGYVQLVRARSPPALIILAFYAAAITAIRNAWYTQNWAEYVLHGISLALDEDMQHWLHWPMQQLLDRMGEIGVR